MRKSLKNKICRSIIVGGLATCILGLTSTVYSVSKTKDLKFDLFTQATKLITEEITHQEIKEDSKIIDMGEYMENINTYKKRADYGLGILGLGLTLVIGGHISKSN